MEQRMAREMERRGCGHIQLTKRQLHVAWLKLLSEPNNQPVRLLVLASPNQPVNSVFLSQ